MDTNELWEYAVCCALTLVQDNQQWKLIQRLLDQAGGDIDAALRLCIRPKGAPFDYTSPVFACDTAYNPVLFDIKPGPQESGTVTLHGASGECGEGVVTLPASLGAETRVPDGGTRIGLNARMVLDALGVFDNDRVSLAFNGSTDAVVLRPVGLSDYTYVMMPI